ncbi:MAG: alanyl-tRNA editing protein [Bacillaceae bacterium]|nr:alanyl-tRNA editing protein [Bacillaceae bacterium]
MTKKIYELDSYMTESLANVREMIEDDEGNVWVSFDQTIFYPEAGGQPYDQGKVDGAQVLNVQIKDKDIFHQVTEKMVKQRVKLKVDFNRRFDHMQQHTGQHLLSAVWKELYQVETTSFHLGPTVCTIDLDLYEITEAEIEKVELYVSQYIYENRSVETYVKTIDEVNIENYPNIKESELYIRFVEIEGVDVSTCCGTHVNALGEIGCVKVIGWEKYKGKTRLHFVCGQRALRYFQQVHAIATELKKKI